MGKNAICMIVLIACLSACAQQPATPSMSLHEAAMLGNLEAIQQHIEAGSNLNERDTMGGASPLITAAVFGQSEVAKALIEAGADVNFTNNEGSTALITAAAFGHFEVARALIEAGADVNHTNNEGSTALHTAALFCRTEIVEALLDNGADKNVKNNAGRTALDSVASPFEDVKDIYDFLGTTLFEPLGFELDYERIKTTRPKIAEMLQ